jgi:serine/threonine-protein kinase RsbW
MPSLQLAIFKENFAWMPTVIFPGSYDSLVKIAELVKKAAKEFGLDSISAYGVEIAVDEACSNIIEHAYGGEGGGSIEFDYQIENDALIITLKDHGKPFNPRKVHKPKVDGPLKDREANGLGLYFMRQWMDEIKFEAVGKTNIVTLIKRKG